VAWQTVSGIKRSLSVWPKGLKHQQPPHATELKRSVHNENPTTSSFKTKIQQLGLKIGQQQKYHTKKMPTICSLSFLAFLNPAIHVLCLRFKSICCASVCTVQCATITAALKAQELNGQ